MGSVQGRYCASQWHRNFWPAMKRATDSGGLKAHVYGRRRETYVIGVHIAIVAIFEELTFVT